MNRERYTPVADDVYLDKVGPNPWSWGGYLSKSSALRVAFAALGGLAAYVLFAIGVHYVGRRRISCQDNLRQISLSLMQYAQDYNGKYPPVAINNALDRSQGRYGMDAEPQVGLNRIGPAVLQPIYVSPYGWADAIQPYLRSLPLLHCPDAKGDMYNYRERFQQHVPIENPGSNRYTDYWFNSNLGQMVQSAITNPAHTYLVGDGDDATGIINNNARYSLRAIPDAWQDNRYHNSPLWRHNGMAYFAFADGHVKALSPAVATKTPRSDDDYTFALSRPH